MQCVVAGEMVQLSPLDVQRAGVLQQFASARQIVLPLTRDELSLWLHFASLPNPCPAALVMVMHVRSSARADLDGVAGLQEAHVSRYLEDADTLAASTGAFAQRLAPGSADHEDAMAELCALSPEYTRGVLLACGRTAGEALEHAAPCLHRDVLVARMELRRFVPGLTLGRGCGPLTATLAAAAPHIQDVCWLDLSGNAVGEFPGGGEGEGCARRALSTSALPSIEAAANDQHYDSSVSRERQAVPRCGGGGAAKATCALLAQLTALQMLDLTSNELDYAAMLRLTAGLSRLRHLQDLFLGSNCLGVEGVAALAPALPCLSSLQLLDLSSNNLCDTAAASLAPRLSRMRLLRCLDLSSNLLTAGGAAAVCGALAQCTPRALFVGMNALGKHTSQLSQLCSALAALSALRDLDVSGARLCDAAAVALASRLPALSKLHRLDVSGNRLTGPGTSALVRAAAALPGLAHLVLSGNAAGADGAVALAATLPVMGRLTRLELAHCGFEYRDVARMAPALAKACALQRLDLSRNSIGDAGIAALGLCLGDCDQLTEVELYDCGVADITAEKLAALAAAPSPPPTSAQSVVCATRAACFEDEQAASCELLTEVGSVASIGDAGNSTGRLLRHPSLALGSCSSAGAADL